jgi:hypothetical protein
MYATIAQGELVDIDAEAFWYRYGRGRLTVSRVIPIAHGLKVCGWLKDSANRYTDEFRSLVPDTPTNRRRFGLNIVAT